MSTLWHILWPGWTTVLGSIWLGVLSLPILVPAQLFLTRWLARRAVAKATAPLHTRILSLESAELSRRIEVLERGDRASTYRGW